MEDGEDYIQNAWNEVYCIECWENGYEKVHEPWVTLIEQEENNNNNNNESNRNT
jgi:hypothetical protein